MHRLAKGCFFLNLLFLKTSVSFFIACLLITNALRADIAHTQACLTCLQKAEKRFRIPKNLLRAIAEVETGRRITKGVIGPWPWSVNVKGKSHVFKTKKQALHFVRRLSLQRVASVDVGCMQINLKHHPDAFASLDEAFDIEKNVHYAAKLLSGLAIRGDGKKDWSKAVAFFHSRNPKHHVPYQQKVWRKWIVLEKQKRITQRHFEEHARGRTIIRGKKVVSQPLLKPVKLQTPRSSSIKSRYALQKALLERYQKINKNAVYSTWQIKTHKANP